MGTALHFSLVCHCRQHYVVELATSLDSQYAQQEEAGAGAGGGSDGEEQEQEKKVVVCQSLQNSSF